MATKSPTQQHSDWGSYSLITELPNVAGAVKQDVALEVGDLAYVTGTQLKYVCKTATLGAAVWDTMGGGGGGAGEDQIFSIAMLLGQEVPIVPDSTNEDRQTYRTVVGNAAVGDTIEQCDYLDIGDGAQLQVALTAAGLSQSEVFIRSGTYNLGLAGSPATRLVVPAGVRVIGAGRNQVTIVTRDGGDGSAFSLGNHCWLEEMRIYCTAPTDVISGSMGIVECLDPDGSGVKSLIIEFADWSNADPSNVYELYAAIEVVGDGTYFEHFEILDFTGTNGPTVGLSDDFDIRAFELYYLKLATLRNIHVDGFMFGLYTHESNVLMDQFEFRDFSYNGISISYGDFVHISGGVVVSTLGAWNLITMYGVGGGGSLSGISLETTSMAYAGINVQAITGLNITNCNSVSSNGLFPSFVTLYDCMYCTILGCNMGENFYSDYKWTGAMVLGDNDIAHCFTLGAIPI